MSRGFTSSRLFLGLGIALVVLAVAIFPVQIPIQAQPMDVDYYGVGWLLAPIIGVWGLASIVLGLVQSASPRQQIEYYLYPLVAFISISLIYALYMAFAFGSGLISRFNHFDPFWWLYFGLILAPSLLIYVAAFKYMRTHKQPKFLENKKVRAAMFAVLAVVPLSYMGVFLFMLYAF